MEIYHYSKRLYKVLLTAEKSGTITGKDLKEEAEWAKEHHRPESYARHISFFIDPVPLDIIGKLFKGENDFWFDENEVYEYVVETSFLDDNILFSLVESPTDVEDLDNTRWIDTPEFKKEYIRTNEAEKRKSGETGNGIVNLDKQIIKYKGKTREFFIKASKRSDFKDNVLKYAASVPHLMLYPKSGAIKILSVNKVKIGSENRRPINMATESIGSPTWAQW